MSNLSANARLLGNLEHTTAELLEGFTLEEQQQLNEYLGRIARNMERVVEKEPEQDKTGVKNF